MGNVLGGGAGVKGAVAEGGDEAGTEERGAGVHARAQATRARRARSIFTGGATIAASVHPCESWPSLPLGGSRNTPREGPVHGPQYFAPTAWNQAPKLLWYVAGLQTAPDPAKACVTQASA